jgi:hypothetical protein
MQPVIDFEMFDRTEFEVEAETTSTQEFTVGTSVYIDELECMAYPETRQDDNYEWERYLWEEEREHRQPKKIKARGTIPKMAKQAYKQRNHQSQRQRYQQKRKGWR